MDKYTHKVYGDELRFYYCPICDKYDESNPDFSVNVKTGMYTCHKSGKGGNIKDLENWDYRLPEVKEIKEKKKNKINFSDFFQARADKHLGADWLSYLKERGISEKGLGRLCRLGKNNSMMIPLTNGKEVVGIKYRTLDKKCSAEKDSATDYFLNWQNIKDKSYLIIVEGEIDLLSAIEVGYDNVVSLPFGAKNLKCIDTQKEWISKFSKIIIAVDNDGPEEDAKEHILEKLAGFERKLFEVDMREFKATKTDLLTKNGILENLGYFLGSAQSIPKFWSWLLDESKEEYLLEIPHYGIIDNVYYDESSRVICTKQDLKIHSISSLEALTEEQLEWLNKNLINLRNDSNQSLLGICWALGRFHISESYPILEVSGTTSIGKTEYVEFISRILFGNKENIKSFTTLSNHQIRSLSSCSNITPWVIDEVKITGKNLKEKAIELYSILRAVYDNKTINQGNITAKLTEFKLCTPLIISGETELSDVSIKNRMISTNLNKKNKSSDEIFFTLKHTDLLEKFGKLALQRRLDKGAIDIPLQEVKEFLKDVKDERQLYNGRCMLTGLKALTELIKIDSKIITEFVEFLNRRLANEYNVVSNFLELLELVVESGQDMKYFYKIDNGRHLVRFNLLYKAIAEEHNKTNSTLELLDMRTLKKQLLEEKFIINTRVSTRFPKDSFSLETISVKADEFKVVDFIS